MKNVQMRLAVLLLSTLGLFSLPSAHAQLTPLGDSYTNTAAATTNYGAKTTLAVSSTDTAFIQFNLSSIPASYTGADVTQATLKLYVNAVTTAGSFNVDYVNGTWTEDTIDASNAPALGTTIAASVPLVTADKNQYILVNVTAAIQAWLNGTANDGIALVANNPLNASFDSKESTTTSHAAELDVVFSGGGTLTGITTASGSGLTGGGTSGTLDLSLTNACAANQVLQWNGTAWTCAAVGTGTITGVTAGTGLAGGGTSGTVTLGLASSACAYGSAISALPFTCFPFAVLGANTFTASQTVTGNLTVNGEGSGNITASAAVTASNLTASGTVSGSSYLIGSNLFDYGSYANGNASLGFGGNTASTGQDNTASGYEALASNTTGSYNTANGVSALQINTTGSYNVAVGYGSGQATDHSNITGTENTAVGVGAHFNTGSIQNATAIGYCSFVDEANALVLGSINGQACGTANVSVGIGTSAPGATLDVRDNGYGGNTISAISGAVNNAVYGQNTSTSGNANGASFWTASPQGTAVVGVNTGTGGNDYAGYFQGNVYISGNLAKGSGSFKIDHPLDPGNKYLYHSFVESPDMMNVYNGNVVTNQHGAATVTLPDYFEALNQDFRYQLTVIGQFAQAIVAKEIRGNRFTIKTSKPGVKVSWQVTGIRHDAYADANRIQVEVAKPPQEQGRYLHPELFGAPAEQAIGYHVPPVPTERPAQAETAKVLSLKTPAPLK